MRVSRHSTLQIPLTTLTFDRFLIYELRQDSLLPFQFVLCLSSTATNYRHEVKNISFLPLISGGSYADHDPYRVPIAKSTTRLTSRMYVAIDAIQSINKAAFHPRDLGRISATAEAEVREKLTNWLGMHPLQSISPD